MAALAACQANIPSLAEKSGPPEGYYSDYEVGEPLYVRAVCKDKDYTIDLARRFSRAEFSKSVQEKQCIVFPMPIPGVLVEQIAWGIDYEGRDSSVWEVRLYQSKVPFYIWLLDGVEEPAKAGGIIIDPTKGLAI